MGAFQFLKQFLLHPSATGAIAASSASLARLMVETAGVREAGVIVEFGPGTGVFTEEILRVRRPDADFLAMELNPEFAELVRRRCPTAQVYVDSATNTRRYLEERGHSHCDCIVSGLPWAAFPEALQDQLLDTIADVLRPGGRLVTFAYLQGVLLPAGAKFKRKLKQRFRRVSTTHTVWLNLPPAFVYCAET
jgi:phosphatidylethanolamine/phosphatidyl-N-methylethanolamine N-methyltransferase